MGNISRSRWAAIGAAVAVTLGAGGLVGVNAAGSASSLIPINPARILDTRSSDRVGSLDVAGASDPYRLKVAGVSGIPSTGVTGVSLNVTAVDTQSNDYGGFVTVYPCASTSSTRPDVSNLNFRSGQTLANSVTVPVSDDGYICFYVYGTAHLLADANGYYTESASGGTVDAYTKAESDARYITEVDAYTKTESDARYITEEDAYTKTESDARYITEEDAYTKTESDARYITEEDAYTKTESDARYITEEDAYTKAESDERYAALGESNIIESIILDRNETSFSSTPALDLTSAGLPVLAVARKSIASTNPLFPDVLEMKLVFCEVISCAGDTNTVIDLGLPGAALPELKLTSGEAPVLTYATVDGNFLTRCSTTDCSGGISSPITLSDQAVAAHLQLDSNDLAAIAWVDGSDNLQFTKCENVECSSRQSNTVATGAESSNSDSMALAIPPSGNPILAYAAGADYLEVRLIYCNDAFCAGGDENVVTIDADALPENGLDLALNAGGLPVVTYVDSNEKISIIICQNADCSNKTDATSIAVGDRPTIAIDNSGSAHVAFLETYTRVTEVDPGVSSSSVEIDRLSAIRCGDAECTWIALDQTWPGVINFDGSIHSAIASDGTLFVSTIDRSLNAKLTRLP